jgi:hypothetical protein
MADGSGAGGTKKTPLFKLRAEYDDSPKLEKMQCDKMNHPDDSKKKEKDKWLKDTFPKLGKDYVFVNDDQTYNCHGFSTNTHGWSLFGDNLRVNNNPDFGSRMTKLDKFDYNTTFRPGQVVTYGPFTNGVPAHSAIQGADGLWYHKLSVNGPLIATHSPDEVTGAGDASTGGQGLYVGGQYVPR